VACFRSNFNQEGVNPLSDRMPANTFAAGILGGIYNGSPSIC
jgi:hypothetical protein